MARIRSIKPEFFTDEKLAECSPSARLLFVGCWVFGDDNGNLDRSAKQLQLQVFPGDDVDVEEMLDQLMARLLLVEYSVSGKIYLHIPMFNRHQKIDKPSKPRFPLYEDSLRTPRALDEHSRLKGRESKGVEGRGVESSLPLPSVAAVEPQVVVLKSVVQKHNSGIERETGFTVAVWDAYSGAYQARYQVEPVRNRTVNGQLAQLVSRLGIEAAPAVAAFYVEHNSMLYVRAKHPVNLLLRDAEGLHTEWLRGETVTSSEAFQADRTAGTGNVFRRIIATLPPEPEPMTAKGGDDDDRY